MGITLCIKHSSTDGLRFWFEDNIVNFLQCLLITNTISFLVIMDEGSFEMLYESNALENFDLEIIFPTSLSVKDMGSGPLKWQYCQQN